MLNYSTTRLTSRGQVVIPEEIRKRLGLKEGAQFIVMGEGDAIIFKTIKQPSMKDFDRILADTTRQAQDAGLKPSDIDRAVKEVRSRKRRK